MYKLSWLLCLTILIQIWHVLLQETPTKELGDHSSGSNNQVPEFNSPAPTASYLNRFTNSESSTDEEGNTETFYTVSEICLYHYMSWLVTKSPQVVVLNGMMISPPLQLPSLRRHIKTQHLRRCQRLQALASPLHLLHQGTCCSQAGQALQTTPASPSHQPTLLASPWRILPTLTSNKEASWACSHTKPARGKHWLKNVLITPYELLDANILSIYSYCKTSYVLVLKIQWNIVLNSFLLITTGSSEDGEKD